MQLWRGIPVDRARTVMFETRGDPLSCCFRLTVSSHARLDELLHLVERNFHTIPVSLADGLVATHEGGQRHALRRRESCVPSRPVLHRADCFSASVNVFARSLMPYELLIRYRVLPIGQTLEVLFPHFAGKTPFLCQSAMPLAAYPITLGVVVLLGIGEFFLVIGLRLASTERLGNGKHNSLTGSMASAQRQYPSGVLLTLAD